MFDQLSTVLCSPWVYAVVGASILLDVFLPVLPSGALLIAAATAGSANHAFKVFGVLALLLCAATASCVGDLAAYHLARSGRRWFRNRSGGRSSKLAAVQERLREVVAQGGGTLVVLARFAPAGRSVVSVAAGAAHQRVREFLPWSALAGVVWAGYSVGIGYLGGQWLGASWFGTALSFCALLAAGSVAARVFRRGAEESAGSKRSATGGVSAVAALPGPSAPVVAAPSVAPAPAES